MKTLCDLGVVVGGRAGLDLAEWVGGGVGAVTAVAQFAWIVVFSAAELGAALTPAPRPGTLLTLVGLPGLCMVSCGHAVRLLIAVCVRHCKRVTAERSEPQRAAIRVSAAVLQGVVLVHWPRSKRWQQGLQEPVLSAGCPRLYTVRTGRAAVGAGVRRGCRSHRVRV